MADLPRAGLGNRLLPWARCKIYSSRFSIPMLTQRWAQLKFGAVIRGESDLRTYHNLFQKSSSELGLCRSTWVKFLARREPEPADLRVAETPKPGAKNALVVFAGEKDYFAQLAGHDRYLHEQIRAITRPRWLVSDPGFIAAHPIGIHVRRSDFKPADSLADFQTKGHLQTPTEWFVKTLRRIRNVIGQNTGAFIVTDGQPGEIRELLAEPNVVHRATGSAIGDLLLLAQARLLIGSGSSSFSAWAAFLGQMPAFCIQGLNWFKVSNRHGFFLDTFDPDAVDIGPLERQIKEVLAQGRDEIALR